MTQISRPVKRETRSQVQGRVLMVELSRYSITLRQKGKRSGYSVPLEAVFHLGGKMMRRELDAAKKVKRGSK